VSCTPERVTGYVDDVLGSSERAEVEAHITSCATCLAQAAAERDLRAGLRSLPVPEPRPDFEADVRRRLAARSRRRSAWLLPLAASLVLLALWGRGAASFVAWELSRDHTKCFGMAKLPATVWSSDPVEVTAWFEEQGTRLPPVPPAAGDMGLVGARYCHLLDRYAAHLFYASEERRFSVFVISGPVRFADTWGTESRGQKVRFLRSAGTTVALVGDKAEDIEAFRSTFTTTLAWLDTLVAANGRGDLAADAAERRVAAAVSAAPAAPGPY